VIFREFDGLGLGIKDHDAFTLAWHRDDMVWQFGAAPCRCYFDLQINRGPPQVKKRMFLYGSNNWRGLCM